MYDFLKSKVLGLFTGINRDNLKEDLRKLSIILIGGGLVGLIVGNDKVAAPEAFALVVFGLVFWLTGLYGGNKK